MQRPSAGTASTPPLWADCSLREQLRKGTRPIGASARSGRAGPEGLSGASEFRALTGPCSCAISSMRLAATVFCGRRPDVECLLEQLNIFPRHPGDVDLSPSPAIQTAA